MRLGERGEREREREGRRADCCVWFLCVPVGMVESRRRREMRRAAAASKELIHPSSSTAGAAAAGTHVSCVVASSCSLVPWLTPVGRVRDREGRAGEAGEIDALLLHP